MNTRWGGFLDHVDQFDAQFFGISPREAAQMDPQQRLAMEIAWEALADAGLPPTALAGTRTGVFFGIWKDDYATLMAQQSPTAITQHTAVGLDTSVVAGRISYALGLHGPSLVVNTACSSSLVAVHLACESLQRGESSLAIAGGVNLLLAAESTVAMSKFGGLSPDGRCFTFDARANGYVRGEGAGAVVLKPLRRAIEDGDPIYCVIRGSGMNNNGAGNGLTATSRKAQMALLREVYERAGIPPSRVHYVEAHGTGTALGDPKEVSALAGVLGADRDASRPLRIGSCKTNIGHLEAAAGIAGLVKVALSMRHRTLPPNLNFEQANPKIAWGDANVVVQQRLEPWPHPDEPAVAGVSSAGFGGTNAHVVVEEFRPPPGDRLLPLSAGTPEALRELARSFRELSEAPYSVEAICAAAAARLSGGEHRLAVLVRSRAAIREQLDRWLSSEKGAGIFEGRVARGASPEPTEGQTLEELGALYVRGGRVAWHRLYPGIAQPAELPEAVLAARGEDGEEAEEPLLFPISAHTEEALRELSQQVLAHVERRRDLSLRDLSYTASVRRGHLPHRLCAVARTRAQLVESLAAFGRGESAAGLYEGREVEAPGVVFVFPGQGSQWFGMGRELLAAEPVFRRAVEECDEAIRPFVDYSLIETLTAADEAWLDRIDIVQPALFAIGVGLARLWRSYGVEPSAVIGHSMGEVAAAHVAGILGLEDAARVICKRSQLMRRVRGRGAMAVVELSWQDAERALAGYEERLCAAVSNGPRTTVLAGEPEALKELLGKLEAQEVFCRLLKVDMASHSPQVDPLLGELAQILEGLRPEDGAVPLISTVTGERACGRSLGADYWVRNLRQPVRFFAAIERLAREGNFVFVEMSPHPGLLQSIEEGLRHLGCKGATAHSLRRQEPEVETLRGSLGAVYTLGYPVRWDELHPAGGRCVPLPAYAFQRETLWFDAQERRQAPSPSAKGVDAPDHLLSGAHLELQPPSGAHIFQVELGLSRFAYLTDHRVGERAALPAAAFLEMALAGARRALGEGLAVLERVSLVKPFFLPEQGEQAIQLFVDVEAPGQASFRVASPGPADSAGATSWTLHVSGSARLARSAGTSEAEPLGAIQARCPQVLSADEHYGVMRERDLHYGPAFRGIEQVYRRDGEALARLRWTIPADAVAPYHAHPAALDACLQSLLAALPGASTARGTYVPARVERLELRERLEAGQELWAHAVVRSSDSDQGFTGDVSLRDASGRVLLEVRQMLLRRLDIAAQERLADWLYEVQWEPQSPSPRTAPAPEPRGRWLILADRGGVGEALASRLEAAGNDCTTAFAQGGAEGRVAAGRRVDLTDKPGLARLLEGALGGDSPPCRGIIHLWSLDVTPPEGITSEALDEAQSLGCGSVVSLVQALVEAGGRAPGPLFLVTRGAQTVSADDSTVAIGQAPLLGLARTLAYEHPELGVTRIDLDPHGAPLADAGALLREVERAHRQAPEGREEEIALRGERRYVGRLGRAAVAAEPASSPVSESREPEASRPAGEAPFRACVRTPGTLSGVSLEASARCPPGPGKVEIEVEAVGLNFRDVLKVLGLYPGVSSGSIALGDECAGRIVAVGEGVTDVAVGDEVVAIVEGGGLGTHAVADAALVVPRPAGLSAAESAALPVVFLTAFYALHHVGRMERGERVLIHSAAGGVGLAAVALAQRAGAEIFATAGTEEKRAHLRSLGVTHVMDSHSLDFAEEVMARTGGEGVDLVLNSLAGAFLTRSLETLRENGRFLEIGKRDIFQNSRIGLRPLANNVSFSVIDLELAWQKRPALVGAMLRSLMRQIESGELRQPPVQVYPVTAMPEAFHALAHSAHLGKIAVSLGDRQSAQLAAEIRTAARLDPAGAYLITGGLGGLGLSVARWMVERGARHLVLIGRRAPSAEARRVIGEIERAGAEVHTAEVDVSDAAQVGKLFSFVDRSLPPLRGAVHAAGLLDDALIARLSQDNLQKVAAPKVKGAWNLYTEMVKRSPEFVVLFSSAASLIGLPGQASYAAANAFLDALSHFGRRRGAPVLSINWGPWSEVGLAAAQKNRGDRLEARGLQSISVEQGLSALEKLLEASSGRSPGPAQVGVMPFDVQQWGTFYPGARTSSWLSRLRGAPVDVPRAAQTGAFHERLGAARPAERRALIEAHLRELCAKVLRLSPDRIAVDRPLQSMGLDSLMTMELKNRLEASLGLSLSVTLIWSYPTLSALGPQLARRLNLPLHEPEARPEEARTEDVDGLVEDISRLSREEALRLLSEELEQLSDDSLISN